jgi:tetrapyrrole methylase family protein/MazG family protein
VENKTVYSFEDFENIIARLRAKDGCPWDQVQTHESLRNCMIEEAYEVVDGIDTYCKTGSDTNLCEELGDVLLQVVMHACIAEEEGRFTMGDVIQGISEKMIRRHPHVFGTASADTPEKVLENWEAIKEKEKHEETLSDGMKRVAKSFPANIRAAKVQKKAAKVGFDFEDYRQAAGKVDEELGEMLEAVEKGDSPAVFEEFGDLMFSIINLSRFLDVNAENALTNATEKFINRFEYIENSAVRRGLELKNMTIDEMDELWNEIKHSQDRNV